MAGLCLSRPWEFQGLFLEYIKHGGITMTIVEMLGQSGILTLLGMGVVFGFLALMVVVINQVGKFLVKNELDQRKG